VAEYGNRIAVIGGGNTAMDTARTANRLISYDGKVTVVYRRTIKQMPADLGEIKAVIDEGVDIMELTAPERINMKNGRVLSLSCSRMKLGEKDSSGRQSPLKIPDSEFEMEFDTIIPAIGQELAFDFGDNETLLSNTSTFESQILNIFIGGDALRGASTAINAIGDGRKVAQIIIDREGVPFATKPRNTRIALDYTLHMCKRARRSKPAQVSELPVNKRKNFNLVASTLHEDEVIEEAKRCLLCDEFCSICTTVCPNLANHTYRVVPISYNLQRANRKEDGSILIEDYDRFVIEQPYQILNIANFCNECGNCKTFCPSAGAPYIDKPKLNLTRSSFDNADEGYFFEKNEEGEKLTYKFVGKYSILKRKGNDYSFETDSVKAHLDGKCLSINKVEFTDYEDSFSTHQAVAMSIIMKGAAELNICQ